MNDEAIDKVVAAATAAADSVLLDDDQLIVDEDQLIVDEDAIIRLVKAVERLRRFRPLEVE